MDELETRARIFKSKNVNDFSEYRKSSGIRLPRVLLVIDEFQILFSESRQVAEAAEQLLSKLLKQGRSFGIHILLAMDRPEFRRHSVAALRVAPLKLYR